MQEQYAPKQIETDAQRDWETQQYFAAKEDPNQEKFYCLSMFPYPSGRLHMGHVRNYSIGDAIARYQHMQGKNVLQPIGWDAFGLPAENAAIENKVPPAQWTHENINAMRAQLKQLGFAYDWSRELATCEPEYYRWEQWLFLQLYKKGLAYKKNAVVNWDPVDNTVLANEQVVDGRGWRSGALIERREISQWFIKITAYADELLQGLDTLTGWPEQVRSMQRHWIGRSEGVNVTFDVDLPDSEPLQIFTTRVDTIMGASFLGISAEHPLAQHAANGNPEIQTFLESCRHQKTAEAELATQEKRGIDSGLVAIHPLTQEKLPIWIANFVLMEYGTGAVMAVPAHDVRDHEFATKYNLPIKQVLEAGPDDDITKAAFTHKNKLINSEEFSGLNFEEAIKAITGRLIELGKGEYEVHYRLRDWGVSRQRYWGTPIPIIYCKKCGAVPVPEADLPVVLPTDVTPEGTGSPLAKLDTFCKTTCPTCQGAATRETDTFDTFVESSWYYARYACPDLDTAILDERANYWTPVDQYIGGIEHAVMHLLYARFFHKVLRDEGFVESDEPMTNLLTQGMVLKDGSKMSKSKGNTVDPADLIEKYGADTVRLFTLFAAPPEQSLEWSDSGVEGGYRFLKRLWRAVYEHVQAGPVQTSIADVADSLDDAAQTVRREVHKILAKVSDDIGKRLTFNTAIAANMELINTLSKYTDDSDLARAVRQEALESIVLMLAPIVPHITHTLWHTLGHEEAVIRAAWPTADAAALQQDTLELVVQINGKRRSQIAVASDADQAAIEALVMADQKVQQHLDGKTIKKIIVVPKRLVNVVAV